MPSAKDSSNGISGKNDKLNGDGEDGDIVERDASSDDANESNAANNNGDLDTAAQTMPQHEKLSAQIIATLSTNHAFATTLFQISDTVTVDGIERKVFIPVKRDESAVGPTLVRDV